MLKELYEYFAKIEEVLATLEELMSKEGLERIQKSLEDYKKKMFEHLVNSAYFPSVPLINSLLKGKTDQSAIII